MPPPLDPYGEEYGDWEDPWNHVFLTECTGCAMCVSWKDRTYEEIKSSRIALVLKRRARETPEPTCQQVAQEDRNYWNDTYSGA
jgi:hypothetical protein